VIAYRTDRHAKMASSVHGAVDATQEAGDADKADLFTGFSRALDGQLVPGSASSGA
jgi:starvation-inducible DNA-binding protein